MKIVLVEDRPWKLEESIKKIREKGIELYDVIYVCKNRDIHDELAENKIKKLEASVEKLMLHKVDNENFDEKLKMVLADPQCIILCDFNLTGDNREYFDKRVNVMFAKRIAVEENGVSKPSPRMYFYTTAGKTTNDQINAVFPKRNITVAEMNKGQVILDFDEIEKVIKEYSVILNGGK